MGRIRRYSLHMLCAVMVLLSLVCRAQEGTSLPPEQPETAQPQPPVLQLPQVLPQFPSIPAQSPRLQEGSYLFIYRTPAHVQRSDPDTFHNAARAVRDLLREQQVSIFEDPMRGTIETSETFSMESVLNLARQSGGTYLIYVTIDRPVTKWLKILLQCYDLNGKLVWQEEAAHGGGWNSSESIKKITNELNKRLTPRLGGPGLPPILTGIPEEKPAGKPGGLL